MGPEINQIPQPSSRQFERASQEGYCDKTTIIGPKGKLIVIAFNKDHTEARVFYQTDGGSFFTFPEKPSKVFISSTKVVRQKINP